jgi:hypothetical protein
LLEGVCTVELDDAVAGQGAEEVHDDGEVVALGRRRDVPLEGVAEHGLEGTVS